MERKIGEVFESIFGIKVKVVKGDGCTKCAFKDSNCFDETECRKALRSDKTNVIFARVKPEHINDITDPEFPEPQMDYES